MRKFLLALSAAAGMGLGTLVCHPQNALAETTAQGAIGSKQLDRLIAAFEGIRANHVDEVDEGKLVDAAINAMVSALGSPADYLDAEFFRDLQVTRRGLGVIGLELTVDKGALTVVTPLDDTPAADAGVLPNDVITHIEGTPVQGLATDRVAEMMPGQPDTTVRLTIARKGRDRPLELALVRRVMRFTSVRMRREGDDIGYIRIAALDERTMQTLTKATAELAAQRPSDKLKGYVLDLRNSPGGLRDVAVAVADAFLDAGEIVSVGSRGAQQVEHFHAQPGDLIEGAPLVVLVNAGTASGAEIVAGALQHHKRATVVGSRSFGKGLVPSIVPLGGRNGALRLMTARYFTPAGRSFDRTGIVPDIEVPQEDDALRVACDLLRGVASSPAAPPNPKL